jgi:bifunctional DNase/RNase
MTRRTFRKAKSRKEDYKTFVLFILGIAVLGVLSFAISTFLEADTGLVKIWPGGTLYVDPDTHEIVFGTNCTVMRASTTEERAEAIELGIENMTSSRPTIYDTFKDILESYNITLDKIEILNYDGEYYYADAIFSNKDKTLRIDILPSNGIALALRTGSEIYLNKTLLDEYGKDIC